jgi:catechol 2,3-dioxygenase-like lactoylglutathione lyase family enzyme
MSHPVMGIDHVYLLVDDLAQSRDAFARLGFTISPRGLHSASKGTANHTIMFPHDYFELLGVVADTPDNADRREKLARDGQGLHAVACRIADAEGAKAALAELGIATGEVGSFSRPVPLPGGGEANAAFRTLQFEAAEVPVGTCFMCQHLTRDSVWIPELIDHANGANGLAGIVAGTDDPSGAAERFGRLFADGRTAAIDGGMRTETGASSAPLVFLSREALASRYPDFDLGATPTGAFAALQVHVPDEGRARSAVEQGGLSPVRTASGFAIGPANASGTILEFVAR